MDPSTAIGLVAACGSLAAACIKVTGALHSLAETFKHAELSLLGLVEECATIQPAWKALEAWATRNTRHLEHHQQIFERLARSVYAGQLIIAALEEDMSKAVTKSSGFRRRASLSLNAKVFQEHQERIRGQVNALQLLLQVISLPSNEDRIEVLTIQENLFRQVDDSVRSIIDSSVSVRSSNASCGKSSTASSGTKKIRYAPLSFENDLFTSYVYKRNYRPLGKRTKSFASLFRKERHRDETSDGEPNMTHDQKSGRNSSKISTDTPKDVNETTENSGKRDDNGPVLETDAASDCGTDVDLASAPVGVKTASTYRFTISGSCPRCHYHHVKMAILPFPVPEDEAPPVLCDRCSFKWLSFGGHNATQLSLLSSPSTLGTVTSTLGSTTSTLLTVPSASSSHSYKRRAAFRSALVNAVRTASAIASPTISSTIAL